MLNIKSLDYRLRFLEDITFKEEPEIALFKAIFKRLKSILCIIQGGRCIDCTHNKKCLYNYMSAGDFEYIASMPILINKPLFSERFIKKDDILELNFIFLGDVGIHMDFLNYILKEFEVRGLFKERYKFCIESATKDNVELPENSSLIRSIEVLTPIDYSKYIFEVEKEKIERLNQLYNITDKELPTMVGTYDFKTIKFDIKNPLHMGNNRIMRRGYVGEVEFKIPIANNSLLQILKVIGMGNFYSIGGGQIKFCTI